MIFWTKFAQKGCFRSKIEKVNNTIEFSLSSRYQFSLNWQFWYSGPKRIFHALVRASMVTNYIKLFRTGADTHNGILMSILLLVAETVTLKLLNKHSFLITYLKFRTFWFCINLLQSDSHLPKKTCIIYFIESPLKMMKNLKSSFRSQDT